jgi:hypothetical protein
MDKSHPLSIPMVVRSLDVQKDAGTESNIYFVTLEVQ